MTLLSNELRRRGVVGVAAMTKRMGASEVTIRRDLDDLVRTGMAVRVRGGARLADEASAPTESEPPDQVAQSRFAQRLTALVRPGQVVGVTGGRFALTVARTLLTVPDVGIVSNVVPVIDIMRQRTPAPMVVVGGVITESGCLAGPLAVEALNRLHLDMVFFEGEGVDPAAGVTSRNLLEAETTRAFLGAAQSRYLVAAEDQWHRVGLTTVTDLDAIDLLVPLDGPGHSDWDEHLDVAP